MAAYGTWLDRYDQALSGFASDEDPTGRTGSRVYDGSWSADVGGYAGTIPLYGPDPANPGAEVCVRGTGVQGYGKDGEFVLWFPWQDPSGPPSIRSSRVVIDGAVYSRTVVNVLGVEDQHDVFLAPDKNHWSATQTVDFDAAWDLDESTRIEIDPTKLVVIEGVPASPFGGNAMPGLSPAFTRRFLERLKPGGQIRVSAGGASVVVTIGSALPVQTYAITYGMDGGAGNASNSASLSVRWNAGNGSPAGFPTQTVTDPGDPASRVGSATVTTAGTDSGFTVSASTSNPVVTDACDDRFVARYETTGTIGPSIDRLYRARLRCGPNPHPGGLSLSCPSGSAPFDASGMAEVGERIRFWGFSARCNSTYGPYSSSPDSYGSARMWVSGMSRPGTTEDVEIDDVDDRHDFTLPILGVRWPLGTLARAAGRTLLYAGDPLWTGEASSVSGSGIVLTPDHPSAGATLATPDSIVEAYALVRATLSLSAAADRVVTLTFAGDDIAKEYRLTVPPGSSTPTFRTGFPANTPGGFEADRRSSRYPLRDQIGGTAIGGPIQAPPAQAGEALETVEGYEDDEQSVVGWDWQLVEAKTVTVAVAGLEDGESLTVGALELATQGTPTITLADEATFGATGYDGARTLFKERAVAGGAEVGTNEGGTHAVVRFDGAYVDTPSHWRRTSPVTGTAPIYLTLRQFGLLWNGFPGLTWTEGAQPVTPYLDSSAFGTFLASMGGTVSYGPTGGATFEDWWEHPLGTLYAQEPIADVLDYPGMGNPFTVDGSGAYGYATAYGGYKQLRTRYEGAVYDPDTRQGVSGVVLTATSDDHGTEQGTGTTDDQGRYATGAPGLYGNGRSYTLTGPDQTDARKAFNRRRIRSSLLHSAPQGAKTPHMIDSSDGRVFLAYGRGSGLRAAWASYGLVGGWRNDVAVGSDGFRPRLALFGDVLILHFERDGRMIQRVSTDRGKTWRPEKDMGFGYRPEPIGSVTGALLRFRLEKIADDRFRVMVAHRTDAPGVVWSDETAVEDETGAPIDCALEGWGNVVPPRSPQGYWVLTLVPFGSSTLATYRSRQRDALTFRKTT